MRKYLPCLVTSFSLTVAYGQTTVYHPFPDSNAAWVYKQTTCLNPSSNPPCVGSIDYHIYYYILKGDTTVNSITYHKIYKVDSSAVANSGNYVAGIRESAKKIYLTNFSTPETLLYDFSSANIGDTIVRGYYMYKYCYGLITKIDSVQLPNGTWRRAYQTSVCDWPNQVSLVIEGIGSNYDLLQGPLGEEYQFWNILCFHDKDSLIYSTSSCYFSYSYAGINETKNNFTFSIFPNPFSAQTVFQIAVPLVNATLSVDNCFGQTVKEITNISGQTVTFYRDDLPCGLYFLRLTEDNKIYTDKLVITDK
jgi:hypothetical protein